MKRRTFIKSAALLSIASAVPAYSNTPQVCSALTNNIDTAKGEAVALISDLHINDDPLIAEFTTALQNIKRRGINNIIIPGDIAEDIPFIRKTYAAISQHFNGKEDNVVAILGNHDVRGSDRTQWTKDPQAVNPYFQRVLAEYKQLNAPYAAHVKEHGCFDRWLGEHHLIALNTDRGLKDQAWFAPATLAWLENKMAEPVPGKRILIVHQSLNDTHWRANLYGGFGEQDQQIKTLLKKYPQTLVITGHIHNGFGVIEAMQRQYGTLIEIPSFNRTENGLIEKGYGFIMYLQNENVLFEAWNFFTDTHYPEYDIHIRQQAVATLLNNNDCQQRLRAERYPWQEIAQQNDGGDDITDGPEHFGIRKLWPAWRWQV
ncbi:metallophosphoesterase family protein [Yokenella regensburgei]|uniref:metallophosphoesterase family protein n=1 Tax=Yokenella regensburgei TaxID=158877 RepID=UPI003ED91E94